MQEDIKKIFDKAVDAILFNYPKITDSLFHLEARDHRRSLSTYIDIRDILSHLVTISKCLTKEQAEANYINMCEHIRRAIVEPYQITLELKLRDIHSLYDLYKRNFLKREKLFFVSQEKTRQLRGEVESQFKKVSELWFEGRLLKSADLQSIEFEKAISSFLSGYNLLNEIEPKIEELYSSYYARKTQILVIGVFLLGIMGSLSFLLVKR